MLRHVHLFLNQHYSQIKHWLLISLGVVLLVFSAVSLGNQNRLLKENEKLTKATHSLSEDNKSLNQQNKDLATQNKDIAQKNQDYIRCVAQVFADYTHNFAPINIENLDTCQVSTTQLRTSGGDTTPTPSAAPSLSGDSSSSSNNTPASPAPQPDNSQPKPGIPERVMDLLRRLLPL